MTTSTFTVEGMTCSHCVASVTEEISAIAGVTDVEVDLDSGRVEITADTPVDEADVRAAVDEAGYTLLGAAP